MSEQETVAVLAAHVLREVDPACSCGWDWDSREVTLPSEVDFDSSRYRLPSDVRPEQHRAHVAAALAPVLAAREAIAEERGHMEGYEKGLLAPQSEWMKARRADLAEAWDEGYEAGSEDEANARYDLSANPYRGDA